jgi:hypothetical protein
VSRVPLPDKVEQIHRALAAVPHAFGGALALAYWAEPRATVDIDVNVFVSPDRVDEVLGPLLALGVRTTGADEKIERDGQARVMWQDTPVDLFFAYDPFQEAAHAATVEVPFADGTIPILSAEHLTVGKAVSDRPKDWVDIEAMIRLGTHLDPAEVLRWVGRIAGDDDPRYERVAALVAGGG